MIVVVGEIVGVEMIVEAGRIVGAERIVVTSGSGSLR